MPGWMPATAFIDTGGEHFVTGCHSLCFRSMCISFSSGHHGRPIALASDLFSSGHHGRPIALASNLSNRHLFTFLTSNVGKCAIWVPRVYISWVFGGLGESNGRDGGEGWGTEGSGGRNSSQISGGELCLCDLVSPLRLHASLGERWAVRDVPSFVAEMLLCRLFRLVCTSCHSLLSGSSPSFLFFSSDHQQTARKSGAVLAVLLYSSGFLSCDCQQELLQHVEEVGGRERKQMTICQFNMYFQSLPQSPVGW